MTINCIVVDDDPITLFYFRNFIEQTPFLRLAGAYLSPADALKALETAEIQLIFMDIDLPGISGIEFSKLLNSRSGKSLPHIILISNSESYALQGYSANAIEYLLKPASYDAFLKAAMRAKAILDTLQTTYSENDYLFLPVEYELVKVYMKHILYVEGFKDYVKVYTSNTPGFIKSLGRIKTIEEKLPAGSFVRIHRSFIVSVDKIDAITKTTVKIGKVIIPISDQYKDSLKMFAGQ